MTDDIVTCFHLLLICLEIFSAIQRTQLLWNIYLADLTQYLSIYLSFNQHNRSLYYMVVPCISPPMHPPGNLYACSMYKCNLCSTRFVHRTWCAWTFTVSYLYPRVNRPVDPEMFVHVILCHDLVIKGKSWSGPGRLPACSDWWVSVRGGWLCFGIGCMSLDV